MAANRPTTLAPAALTRLSKATLADIVWELAAVAPGCTSCDDEAAIWNVIKDAAESVKASPSDMRFLAKR